MKYLAIAFVFVFAFTACKKEKAVEVTYQVLQLPSNMALTDIAFSGNMDSLIWVSAGNRFGRGAVFFSSDAGANWQQLLDSDQEIKSLSLEQSKVFALPIGNSLLYSNDAGQAWSAIGMQGWEFWHSVAVLSDSIAILVGGENFGRGAMRRIQLQNSNNSDQNYAYELRDIAKINDSTLVAVGYGLVMRSSDFGQSWKPDDVRGDFYKAVHFPDSKTGYVVGEYGSILKTEDAGLSWQKIRAGSTLLNENNRLETVFFEDATHGVVAGKNGQAWYTNNGGKRWTPLKNLPDLDFKAVQIKAGKIWLAAEEGKLIIADIP